MKNFPLCLFIEVNYDYYAAEVVSHHLWRNKFIKDLPLEETQTYSNAHCVMSMNIEGKNAKLSIEIRIFLCKLFKTQIIWSKDVKLKPNNSKNRIHYIYILVLAILCEHLVSLWNTVHVGSHNNSSCTLATWGKFTTSKTSTAFHYLFVPLKFMQWEGL